MNSGIAFHHQSQRFVRTLLVDPEEGVDGFVVDVSFKSFGTSMVLISTAPGSSTGQERYLVRAM
jgi:hypothetical protein